MASLWAGCKHRGDHTIPNVTPHNQGSDADLKVTKQESIAEPSSTDLDSTTIDSQSVVGEATKDRNHSPFASSGSHTTGGTDELPTTSTSSIENYTQELGDLSSFNSSGSQTTEKTDELLISMEQCIQELGELSSFNSSGSHTTEKTDELLLSIENCTQELQEEQQRFATGQYEAE
jgi:hypothetical protein